MNRVNKDMNNQTRDFNTNGSAGRSRMDTRTIIRGVLIVLIASAIAALLIKEIYAKQNRDQIDNVTYYSNQFLDIDGDGDIDYLIYGEVLLNCNGVLCAELMRAPAEPPAPQATPAATPYAGYQPPPTPYIYDEQGQ